MWITVDALASHQTLWYLGLRFVKPTHPFFSTNHLYLYLYQQHTFAWPMIHTRF